MNQNPGLLGRYEVRGENGALLGSFSYGPTPGHRDIALNSANDRAVALNSDGWPCGVEHVELEAAA